MTDVLVQPNFFQTDADESLFSNPDDSLDNFSEQSGLDYTDYAQALQVLEIMNRLWPLFFLNFFPVAAI